MCRCRRWSCWRRKTNVQVVHAVADHEAFEAGLWAGCLRKRPTVAPKDGTPSLEGLMGGSAICLLW